MDIDGFILGGMTYHFQDMNTELMMVGLTDCNYEWEGVFTNQNGNIVHHKLRNILYNKNLDQTFNMASVEDVSNYGKYLTPKERKKIISSITNYSDFLNK